MQEPGGVRGWMRGCVWGAGGEGVYQVCVYVCA